MKRFVVSLILSMVYGAAGPLASAAAKAASVEAYLRGPAVRLLEISPDGSRIAFVAGSGGEAQIKVVRLADRAAVFSHRLGSADLVDLSWIGPETLMTVALVTARPWGLEGGERRNYLAAALDLKTDTVRPLLANGAASLDTVLSAPTVMRKGSSSEIFMEGVYFPDHFGVRALYRTSLSYAHTDRLEEGAPSTTGFYVGADGQAAARTDYDQKTRVWSLWAKKGPGWRLIHREDAAGDAPRALGFDADGKALLVRVRSGGAWSVRRVSLEEGAWPGSDAGGDGQRLLKDPASGFGAALAREGLEGETLTFFREADQAVWDKVLRAFPGEAVTLSSWSDDRRHLVVRVEGGRSGIAYYLVDAGGGKADWLADVYPGIGADALAQKRLIRYRASDGAEVAAFLTSPRTVSAGAAPLVVMPRAEMAKVDPPGYDGLAQALAFKGYLVLQPERREGGDGQRTGTGSDDSPAALMRADLAEGARHLVQLGLADPARVCVVGRRYGGFLALSEATLAPDRYRCAVAIQGVSDLRSYLSYVDDRTRHQGFGTERNWRRLADASSNQDPRLDAVSPLLHAAAASAPILLIAPTDGVAIPFAQSGQMAAALKRAGKSATLLSLPSDDDFLQKEDTRLAALNAAIAFVEAADPPDGPALQGRAPAVLGLPPPPAPSVGRSFP